MTLEQSIETHRKLYRDELDFSPSQRTPPVAYTFDKVRRMMVPDDSPLVISAFTADEQIIPDSATQSTQIGMPMSGRMYRYLQGPTPDTPWAAALKALRVKCRRDHEYHRAADRPYWRGSLCWQFVVLTVIGKPLGGGPATVAEAAGILHYDNPEPILRAAFRFIEDTMDDFRAKAEKRAREDEGRGPGAVPAPERAHHVPSSEHVAECPNPVCRARRAA